MRACPWCDEVSAVRSSAIALLDFANYLGLRLGTRDESGGHAWFMLMSTQVSDRRGTTTILVPMGVDLTAGWPERWSSWDDAR